MPRRNWPRASKRRTQRPSRIEYTPPRIAATPSPAAAEAKPERHCTVCDRSLPQKWPHPEHAQCFKARTNHPTNQETHA